MDNQKLKDWSTRTRSDLNALKSIVDNPDDKWQIQQLLKSLTDNFNELDKLLQEEQ